MGIYLAGWQCIILQPYAPKKYWLKVLFQPELWKWLSTIQQEKWESDFTIGYFSTLNHKISIDPMILATSSSV